jgi:predicted Rossmann-fold nucleotide-binding protein
VDLVFNKQKYERESESFLRRQVEQLHFSDVAIALGGSWGTFCELILSFFMKHTIILIEEFEGAVTAFNMIYEFFGAREVNPQVHHGGNLIRVKSVDEAIQKMSQLLT